MAAFDAEEIKREVRKQSAHHEQLHERLSRVTGPVADYMEDRAPSFLDAYLSA